MEGIRTAKDALFAAIDTAHSERAYPVCDAGMARLWRDLDRRIEAEEITTAKAAELFVAEFAARSPETDV